MLEKEKSEKYLQKTVLTLKKSQKSLNVSKTLEKLKGQEGTH